MESPEDRSGRKRLLRSCNECRRSKLRCVPGPDDDERCKRCVQTDRSCVFSEVQSRAKRRGTEPSRISKIEQSIDNIYTLLRDGHSPHDKDTPSSSALQPSPGGPPAPSPSGPLIEMSDPSAVYMPSQQTSTLAPSSNRDLSVDRLDSLYDCMIGTSCAASLLDAFRLECQHYALVLLPQWPLEVFYRERPTLLLAILSTAARLYASEHHACLELELRKTLAAKLIVDGDRNLDLLQTLLVYTSWFHFQRFQTKVATQMLTLVHIALSIALELNEDELDSHGNHEVQRSLLAAYLLSSSTALALCRFQWMRSSSCIQSACQSLGNARVSSLDASLIHAVKIVQLREKIATALGNGSRDRPVLSADRLEITVDALKSQLQVLRDTSPPNQAPWLPFMLESTTIYILEVALYIPQPSPAPPHTTHPNQDAAAASFLQQQPLEAQQLSSLRTALLIDCLDATKRYLDAYLALPHALTNWDMLVDKSQLAHSLVVLIKLFLAGTPHLRRACHVGAYLEAIAVRSETCAAAVAAGKMTTAVDDEEEEAQRPSPFTLFAKTLRRLKWWLDQREASLAGATSGGGGGGGRELLTTTTTTMAGKQGQGASSGELVSMSPLQLVNVSAEEERERLRLQEQELQELLNFDASQLDFMFFQNDAPWA